MSVEHELERCRAEIEAIEAALRSGAPDVAGLCLALADWNGEIALIMRELCR